MNRNKILRPNLQVNSGHNCISLPIFIFLLITVTFCFGFKGCNKSKFSSSSEPLVQVYSNVKESSPRGIHIASRSGVSADFKNAADEELDKLFYDSRALGYTNNLNFSDYTIYVLPDCQITPVNHGRAFLVRADSYDGSIYDQDPRTGHGKIFAAEMVIVEPNGFISNEYIVCDAPGGVDEELRNAIRYGPEHIILKRNDEAEFQRTWYHGNGIGHPLIPSAAPAPTPTPNDVIIDHFGLVQPQK